jgi:hypothetical protein
MPNASSKAAKCSPTPSTSARPAWRRPSSRRARSSTGFVRSSTRRRRPKRRRHQHINLCAQLRPRHNQGNPRNQPVLPAHPRPSRPVPLEKAGQPGARKPRNADAMHRTGVVPSALGLPLGVGEQFAFGGARLCRPDQPQRVEMRNSVGAREPAAAGRDDTAALRGKMRTAGRQRAGGALPVVRVSAHTLSP